MQRKSFFNILIFSFSFFAFGRSFVLFLSAIPHFGKFVFLGLALCCAYSIVKISSSKIGSVSIGELLAVIKGSLGQFVSQFDIAFLLFFLSVAGYTILFTNYEVAPYLLAWATALALIFLSSVGYFDEILASYLTLAVAVSLSVIGAAATSFLVGLEHLSYLNVFEFTNGAFTRDEGDTLTHLAGIFGLVHAAPSSHQSLYAFNVRASGWVHEPVTMSIFLLPALILLLERVIKSKFKIVNSVLFLMVLSSIILGQSLSTFFCIIGIGSLVGLRSLIRCADWRLRFGVVGFVLLSILLTLIQWQPVSAYLQILASMSSTSSAIGSLFPFLLGYEFGLGKSVVFAWLNLIVFISIVWIGVNVCFGAAPLGVSLSVLGILMICLKGLQLHIFGSIYGIWFWWLILEQFRMEYFD